MGIGIFNLGCFVVGSPPCGTQHEYDNRNFMIIESTQGEFLLEQQTSVKQTTSGYRLPGIDRLVLRTYNADS